MEYVRLGRTELMVTKNGFGALPVQRVGMNQAINILRKAYENGINYFDTARFYTDSEEKIGNALSDVRKNIIISTKTIWFFQPLMQTVWQPCSKREIILRRFLCRAI
jgi:aryl-alcohol dehydrogenase-like predicted oxidoreductase